MVTQPNPSCDLLTTDALRECFRPIARDYLAAIVRTTDLPNAEHPDTMPARHDAYVTVLTETLAEAVEVSVWQVRGARTRGRS